MQQYLAMKVLAWLLVITTTLTACKTSAPVVTQPGTGARFTTAGVADRAHLADSREVEPQQHVSSLDKAYEAYIAQYRRYSRQYYVSPAGNDRKSGKNERAAWATIAHAAEASPACSVIWFEPGTYLMSEAGKGVHTRSDGTPSCHKAYVSTTYGGALLRWTGGGNSDGTWWESGSYTDHVGFDISSPGGCFGFFGDGNYGTYAYNRSHDVDSPGIAPPAYCGNGTGGAGILLAIGSSYNTIVDNVIWDIGQSGGKWIHGIYITSTDDLVQNNVVYNVSGACIQAFHQPIGSKIVNNTFANCATFGITFGADACNSEAGANLYIANNIFYGNPLYGNIVPSCGSGSISSTIITNNLVSGGGGIKVARGVDVVKTVTSDPKFANLASPIYGGDFHLQADSAALGKGTPTGAPATDLDGRPRGNPPSIGAYE